MGVCTCLCVSVCTDLFVPACMHTYHTSKHAARVCVCVCVCLYVCVCVHEERVRERSRLSDRVGSNVTT